MTVARVLLPQAVRDVFYAMNDEMDAVARRHLPDAGPYQRPWYWLMEQVPGASAFLDKQLGRFPAGHSAQFDIPPFPARDAAVEISIMREQAE